MPPKRTRCWLTSSSSVRIGVYVGTRRTSRPSFVRAATSVLSRMQEPQNMPAAPAVMYATFMRPACASFMLLALRLGQEEREDGADSVDDQRDEGGSVGDAGRPGHHGG